MSINRPTRTVNDVAEHVKRQFGDESGVQINNGDILRWTNNAQREIVTRNQVLKAKAVTLSEAGKGDYTFPDENIYQIESLHYDGLPIKNVTYREAEEYLIRTNLPSGKPKIWYEWAGVVSLYPIPREGGKEIALLYTRVPPMLDSLQSILTLPDKYYDTLLRFVLHQAFEMDENWDASNMKLQQFAADLDLLSEEERTAQHMTYPTITVID